MHRSSFDCDRWTERQTRDPIMVLFLYSVLRDPKNVIIFACKQNISRYKSFDREVSTFHCLFSSRILLSQLTMTNYGRVSSYYVITRFSNVRLSCFCFFWALSIQSVNRTYVSIFAV